VTEGGVWGGYCNARVGHIQVHWIAGGMVRWGSPETPSHFRPVTTTEAKSWVGWWKQECGAGETFGLPLTCSSTSIAPH